ncbi:VF530 family protein [Lentisphaera profundi]|uniref:VF530 family protein n=1 Tax=Lentisphaera profundi TaxID=1658616 RepID=A0ABY7VWR9_9BACT|nr:VF530 family protein [Lentisphaera profundi]WDE98356.1 VF530 family protein [Lentisphaera profundi]
MPSTSDNDSKNEELNQSISPDKLDVESTQDASPEIDVLDVEQVDKLTDESQNKELAQDASPEVDTLDVEQVDKLMDETQNKNPMDGVTLKIILINLEEYYGWKGLGERIDIRCFNHDPSMKSSLKFLRKNEWARKKVEALYELTFL